MIMMGLHLTGGAEPKDRIPFRRLYLHSLVRTAEGAKMSKTKGTGVDPLQLTQQYRHRRAALHARQYGRARHRHRPHAKTASLARAPSPIKSGMPRASSSSISRRSRRSGLTLEELAAPEIRAKAPYPVPGEGALAHRWIFSRLACVTSQVRRCARKFPLPRGVPDDLPVLLGRFLRLVHRVGEAAARLKRSRGRARRLAQYFRRARCRAAPAASRDAVPHRRAVAPPAAAAPARARSRSTNSLTARPGWADQGADDAMAMLQEIVVAARNIRAEMKLDPQKESRGRFLDRRPDASQSRPGEYGADPSPGVAFRAAPFAEPSRLPRARPCASRRPSICASPTATRSTSPPKSRA